MMWRTRRLQATHPPRSTSGGRSWLLGLAAVCVIVFNSPAARAYTLKIDTRPSHAKVFLTDKYRGETPIHIPSLKQGWYPLRLVKDGYETIETNVWVGLDSTKTWELEPVATSTSKRSPISDSTNISQLLQQADAYFDKHWFLTPEQTNAFAVYQRVMKLLELAPQDAASRRHILGKMRAMAEQYQRWGDANAQQANPDKARVYYERYLTIAAYIRETFGAVNALPVEDVQQQLAELERLDAQPVAAGPTPTVAPQSTPTPAIEATPAPTEAAAAGPTPAPLPTADASADILTQLQQARGDVYAVIIGIGDYQDERIPDLRFTEHDAQEFSNVLTDPRYGGVPPQHVKLLLHDEATYRNIKTAIGKWLRRKAGKEDTVIIYYSGHGAPENGDTYWVTHEAEIENLFATALDNNDIADMLARLESRRVITFLDACYSAATVNRSDQTRNLQTEIPWASFAGEGRVTLSASDGTQLSLELDEFQHGVFTYYLLEGLKGGADANQDGVIELEETWDYVKYQVTDAARQAGNPQTPVLQGTMTAGIALTVNLPFLRQQQAADRLNAWKDRLKALYDHEKISTQQFKKAWQQLETGEVERSLDEFLSGKIPLEIFRDIF